MKSRWYALRQSYTPSRTHTLEPTTHISTNPHPNDLIPKSSYQPTCGTFIRTQTTPSTSNRQPTHTRILNLTPSIQQTHPTNLNPTPSPQKNLNPYPHPQPRTSKQPIIPPQMSPVPIHNLTHNLIPYPNKQTLVTYSAFLTSGSHWQILCRKRSAPGKRRRL